ncbi:aminoacyl-tRNA deacylase [Kordiimonas marina]|uniref:aminoacyl-tRNA deacylase n=1 Tax=Kordiimonas marina TaxID=2872312 RepID=UPI001FF588D5|nr:YbaK/EbsC family protein [Kordiimonas marina]MCJ9429534.1 YbaK/EbsC family protein [Kordiimonas marina]
MTVARTLQHYLDDRGIPYDVMPHRREVTATRIAEAAHIPGKAMAKSVLLTTDHGYLLAVVPASRRVDLSRISHRLDERLGLASEAEAETMFVDCDRGAIPAPGHAYGMRVIVDDRLGTLDDVYFEAGDHETLIHVKKPDFERLMARASHADISRPH